MGHIRADGTQQPRGVALQHRAGRHPAHGSQRLGGRVRNPDDAGRRGEALDRGGVVPRHGTRPEEYHPQWGCRIRPVVGGARSERDW
jgi:hypothetical protein